MHDLKTLQEAFRKALASEQFAGHPQNLYNPIAYTLNLGGKRLRPLLTLIGCEMFGTHYSKAVRAAIGIEIFHNFTLLHDDIMDQAPLRRGNPTVYRKWNPNIAILSGDTMFALAYKYIAQVDRHILPTVLEIFSATAIEVCEGQQLDMDFESMETVSIDQYLEMIRLKTAVLLGCSVYVGALAGGASINEAEILYQWAINLGLAFQLKDDLLDLYAEPDKFGKQPGGDILAGKKTYLFLKTLELAQHEIRNELLALYNNKTTDPVSKVNRVSEIFHSVDVKSHTLALIDEYALKAENNLGFLDANKVRLSFLKEFTRMLMQRES